MTEICLPVYSATLKLAILIFFLFRRLYTRRKIERKKRRSENKNRIYQEYFRSGKELPRLTFGAKIWSEA